MKRTRTCLFAVVGALLASGCQRNEPCRPGTFFLTLLTTGETADADELKVTIVRDGVAGPERSIPHAPGTTRDTVEVGFSTFPAGQNVEVRAAAYHGGRPLGGGTDARRVAAGCESFSITLDARLEDAGGQVVVLQDASPREAGAADRPEIDDGPAGNDAGATDDASPLAPDACTSLTCQPGACSAAERRCKDGTCVDKAACCSSDDCVAGPPGTTGTCSRVGGSCAYACATGTKECPDKRCIPASTGCCSSEECKSGGSNTAGVCSPDTSTCSYPCAGNAKSCSAGGTCVPQSWCCGDGACSANAPAGTQGLCNISTGQCSYPCAATHKTCGSLCIPKNECCGDGDCTGVQSNELGSCNPSSRTCEYTCAPSFKRCTAGAPCVPNGRCCSNADCTAGGSGTVGSCSQGACSYACASTHKSCGGACILADACCGDGDCSSGGANTVGSCNTGTRACSYVCRSDYKRCASACVPVSQCCAANGDDCSAPDLVATDPASNADGVPVNQIIRITFSKDMNHAATEMAYLSAELPAANVAFSWPDNKHLVITPKNPLAYGVKAAAQTYTISLIGAKDTWGFSLPTRAFSFSTLRAYTVHCPILVDESGFTYFPPWSTENKTPFDTSEVKVGIYSTVGWVIRSLITFKTSDVPQLTGRTQIVAARLGLWEKDPIPGTLNGYTIGQKIAVLYDPTIAPDFGGNVIKLATTTLPPVTFLSPATQSLGWKTATVTDSAKAALSRRATTNDRMVLGFRWNLEPLDVYMTQFEMDNNAPYVDIDIQSP